MPKNCLVQKHLLRAKAATAGCDAAQNALCCPSVEGAHDDGWDSGSSQFDEQIETLMSFLGQSCGVCGPGEGLCDVHTQELGAGHPLHSRTVDSQRSCVCTLHNNLLCFFLHSERDCYMGKNCL